MQTTQRLPGKYCLLCAIVRPYAGASTCCCTAELRYLKIPLDLRPLKYFMTNPFNKVTNRGLRSVELSPLSSAVSRTKGLKGRGMQNITAIYRNRIADSKKRIVRCYVVSKKMLWTPRRTHEPRPKKEPRYIFSAHHGELNTYVPRMNTSSYRMKMYPRPPPTTRALQRNGTSPAVLPAHGFDLMQLFVQVAQPQHRALGDEEHPGLRVPLLQKHLHDGERRYNSEDIKY